RGWAEIEVPEWLFDLDYPGQFLRRIKNVTLTIPCVVGPYTGVHAKLTLLGSSTRVDPRLAGPAGRCCGERRGHGCGCGGPCRCREECGRCGCGHEEPPGGYLALPGDPRIVREYAATEAIATSSGQNDSGMFELSFRDERYLPFEFAGAVSRWRIELPPENNFFDLDTVTDVVLHLNYTAREGGEALRRAASEQAQQHLPGGGVRLFDVRHDLPDAWARLTHPAPARRDPDRCDPDREPGGRDARLVLRLGREHFPYLPCGRDIQVCQLGLYVAVRDPDCHASLSARFVAEHDSGHGPDEECQCEGTQVECMVTPGCPVLYHGVLDREFPVLRRGEPCDLGELVFDLPAGQVADVFVVCGYRATCR
ncbi:MAG TPA: hypothetical protein VGS19_19285, partial [Streptosporangiaceae bacterium]|nr:hypothetical protein [Streptosporangiaceae bacterium]